MKNLNFIEKLALILVLVGGLNWGLVGFFGYDLVASLFGAMSSLTRIIYGLVGLSALFLVFAFPKIGRASCRERV